MAMHTFFEQVVEILQVFDAYNGHALNGDCKPFDIFGISVQTEAVPVERNSKGYHC